MRGLEIPAQFLTVYLLIHLRFVGMMFASPFFSAMAAPTPFRYLFAAFLTLISIGSVETTLIPMVLFEDVTSLFIMALREILIGVLIGLLATLPLIALQIVGEQIGMSMGLSMASTVDPLAQGQVSLIGQLQFLVGIWFYFHWNGHLLLVQSVIESLSLVPLGQLTFFPASDMGLSAWLLGAFRLAMQAAIPFYCSVLLADIGLGFLARTVPQMNIFILGVPMKLALGFIVLAVVLPLTVDMIHGQVERWVEFALQSVTALR